MKTFKFKPLLETLSERIVPSAAMQNVFEHVTLASLVVTTHHESAEFESSDPKPADPQMPVTPTPKPPSFTDPKDLEAALTEPTIKAILEAFKKAGGTVTSGPSPTGSHIEFSLNGGPPMIVIDPNNTKDKNDAIATLVFELIRFENRSQQDALIADLKARKITSEQYAVKSERLTYDYLKRANDLLQKLGIKDNFCNGILKKYPTFEDYLKFAKSSGHFQLIVDDANKIK